MKKSITALSLFGVCFSGAANATDCAFDAAMSNGQVYSQNLIYDAEDKVLVDNKSRLKFESHREVIPNANASLFKI